MQLSYQFLLTKDLCTNCCLSIENAHGSSSAVHLSHFTLLLNLTTSVLHLANSACVRVGAIQQSTCGKCTKAFGYEFITLVLRTTHQTQIN